MTKEELLKKSVDELVESLLAEAEEVNKSLDIKQDSKTTADAAIAAAPAMQDDASRGAGRPKAISDVPKTDEDGQRNGQYDASITSPAKEEDQPEANQVKEKNQVKKSVEVDEAEYAEFQAFKKSQADKKAEELRKAEETKQADLIKSAVAEATKTQSAQIEKLSKALSEQTALVKAMANRPQRAKSVTGVQALEKSFDGSADQGPKAFTKSELLDGAEELAKSGKISVDHVIELENNGFIYDKNARAALEAHMAKKA